MVQSSSPIRTRLRAGWRRSGCPEARLVALFSGKVEEDLDAPLVR
jgi:hypothetical protein